MIGERLTSRATPSARDGHEYMVSTLVPGRAQERAALGVAFLFLVAILLALAAFGATQFREIPAFVAAYAVAISLTNLLTALILFAQFSILRSWSLIAISCGYLYAGLIVLPWALTFPEAFATSGLLGAGGRTSAWLYVLWHGGFPLSVIGYVLLKNKGGVRDLWRGAVARPIVASVVIVAGLVCAVTLLVTAGKDLLPEPAGDPHQFDAAIYRPLALDGVIAVGALALTWLRRRSVLDLWLTVDMFTLSLEMVLALNTPAKFTGIWYIAILVGFLTSSVVLFVLLFETSTLYKQLLRALVAQHEERAARLMTGDAVSASIAHELRQPLSSMTNCAGAGLHFLKRAAPDIEEATAAFQQIVDDGHRAGAMIENIRAIFRKGPGSKTSLDVGALVEDSLALARAGLDSHRISVEAEPGKRLPRVAGDQIQLQQVMLNLITNAIDAMAAVAEDRRILRVRCDRRDPCGIAILVEDTGTGLAPALIDRIFDPLFTTKTEGMGMGLAICRSIVEAHGGSLRALPNRPSGAAFELVMPAEAL